MITELTDEESRRITPKQPLIQELYSKEDHLERKKFGFLLLEDAKFSGFQHKDTTDFLFKW